MTVDRAHPRVEFVARAFRVRIRSAGALAALLLMILAGRAAAEPAFGDSDWVAPGWEDRAWYEAAVDTGQFGADVPGPRVAPPDKDPTGETILRAPFRLLFLPLRLVARGSEMLIGVAAPLFVPGSSPGPKPLWSLEPIVTADPSIGFGLTRRLDPMGKSRIQVLGIYGWGDRRRARITYDSSRDTALFGVSASAAYNYRPDMTFFGVGNGTTTAQKSYWLREAGDGAAVVRYGRAVRHEVRLLGNISSISARSGYSGPSNAQRTEVVFTPEEVPFLLRGSTVASVGAAGEVAKLDDIRTPRLGVHLKGQAEKFKSVDESDLDYMRYHVEARAYVPVFSDRQSLAFRALHDWVDLAAGSEALPYYRLPETEGDMRFNGYKVHRFADRHLVLGTAEYRWWFSNKVYALLAANVGEVASQASRLTWKDHHESYGLGLRYGYTDRLAARFDVAQGSEGLVLNFTLQDTF